MLPLIAAAIPGLIGLLSNKNSSKPPYEEEMKKLLSMQMGQVQQADPLRQALLAWAQGLTPNRYQQQPMGGAVPRGTAMMRGGGGMGSGDDLFGRDRSVR